MRRYIYIIIYIYISPQVHSVIFEIGLLIACMHCILVQIAYKNDDVMIWIRFRITGFCDGNPSVTGGPLTKGL